MIFSLVGQNWFHTYFLNNSNQVLIIFPGRAISHTEFFKLGNKEFYKSIKHERQARYLLLLRKNRLPTACRQIWRKDTVTHHSLQCKLKLVKLEICITIVCLTNCWYFLPRRYMSCIKGSVHFTPCNLAIQSSQNSCSVSTRTTYPARKATVHD
jgi:hypothetical protein